jgi:hypothetical protein
MEVLLAAGAYVSLNSTPGICVNPRAQTGVVVCDVAVLVILRAKTNLTEMTLRSLGIDAPRRPYP